MPAELSRDIIIMSGTWNGCSYCSTECKWNPRLFSRRNPMDDFLHNLRSGKLKQPDRGGRSYNDSQYKGSQRRNPMDRRKRDFDSKESFERLNAIKEVLESLSETQKRMAKAYEARTHAEERKARAMEVLAKNLYRMLNPEAEDVDALFALPEPEVIAPDEPTQAIEAETEAFDEDAASDTETTDEYLASDSKIGLDTNSEADADEEPDDNVGNLIEHKRLTGADRQAIYTLAEKMRQEGNSWENIARSVASKGYPTISGKGTWRGVMVKNIFEKLDA
jgi:hypothetical protein